MKNLGSDELAFLADWYLCIGSRSTGPGVAEQIVRIFLETSFEGGRHQRRVEKIEREG